MSAITGTDIEYAARLLSSGEIVGIPTETVYGLAANALDPTAVVKIFEAKNRPFFDPLIVHIKSRHALESYASKIPAVAIKLAEAFWPGPLTLVLIKKNIIPDITTSGHSTVGLRMPAHPLTLELLNILPFPLAAPSANPFGYVSPTRAEHVRSQLGEKLKYILDGGPCKVGIESTIIGFKESGEPIIYRLGGISLEDIESVAGRVQLQLNQSSDPKAPGQLKLHYAPKKPLIIGDIEKLIKQYPEKTLGVISFCKNFNAENIKKEWVLSLCKDLGEAAANLFSAMREADAADIELIITEEFPENGLGRAINDRLKRAAAKKGPNQA